MTAEISGADLDRDPRWDRLAGAERLVADTLAAAGVPTVRRALQKRGGHPALGAHLAEIAVFASMRTVERLELLVATEAAAERAGKPCAATVRLVSGVPIVSMTAESFARLLRAATPPELRDEPVVEPWPLGTAECSVCGEIYELARVVKPGEARVLTCSQRCRSRSRWAHRNDDRIPIT